MSHDPADEASATAACSQRDQRDNLSAARSYSYDCPAPLSGFINLRALLSFVVLLVTWTSLLGAAFAQETHGDRRRLAPLATEDRVVPTWKGPSLVLDTRPPPIAPFMHLQRRQNGKEATATTSASSSVIETDPSATPTDFSVPQPFDTALSNNFTASCANFFQRLLTNQDFKQCRPFSLMLQTSSDFFDASRSFVRITQTLEATCSVNVTVCDGVLGEFARQLVLDENCAVDYANDNPQVLQAYNGLVGYEPLYQASCLRDSEGTYCFANAVTNSTSKTDSYPYYLPLGVPLIGGARPTCNKCLQDAMAIFSAFGGNSTQPISKTYNGAAQLIGLVCGTGFVNQTATPMKGAASSTSTASFTPIFSLIFMFLLYVFQ